MRYFENKIQDFSPGSRVHIDESFWKEVISAYCKMIVEQMPPTFDNCEGGLYLGCAGVAHMFNYVANCPSFAESRESLLTRARNYTDVALSYAASKKNKDPPAAFLLGSGGVYAVGSLVYDGIGQKEASNELCKKYQSLGAICQPVHYLSCGSDELFVGRAGYLCGSLLLNTKFGSQVVSSETIHSICKSIMHSGREYAKKHKSRCPLMYAYYDTEYLGAAHGISTILQMLLSFPEYYKSDPNIEKDIHDTVDFVLGLVQTNGNIPTGLDEVENRRRAESEELVHWCHGTPGIVYLFAKAFLVWKDEKYLKACMRCGELVWQKGLLRKGPGICHGVAGGGYVFLLLYRLTSDERHLYRALKFAEFILTPEFQEHARTPDSPFSLYEGLAGTVCYFADLMQPQKAHFPFFDIFK